MLDIKNLKFGYGEALVLNNVNLHIKEGETVAIIGSNGMGKTTLVNVICGLLKPDKGTLEFKGERIDTLPAHKIVSRGISQVPEGRKIFGELSVEDNLLVGAYLLKSREEIKNTLNYVYEYFPRLMERKNQIAKTLSGGEQQMLAIGRALMSKPCFLIFDEPSLGLMPLLVKQLMKTIHEMKKINLTILLIEQNVKEALRISDRGYVLQKGTMILEGISKELLKNNLLKKAYLGL